MKFYDGMEAVVVEKGKGYLFIATRMEYGIDHLIIPMFFIKPSYEQIGIYHGDTSGIEEGAVVKIWFRNHFKFDWHDIRKSIKEKTHSDNIIKVELVKQGTILTRWHSFKHYFSLPQHNSENGGRK